MEAALWDIVEMEAVEKYYLWNDIDQKYADKPAITINMGFTGDPNAKSNERYTLYFGQGLGHWNYPSIPKAHLKAGEILRGHKAKVVSENKVRYVEYKKVPV